MSSAAHRPLCNPWDLPFEEGGWQCTSCGYILEQQDLLGKKIGVLFHVKGYKCPACGYQRGYGNPFNWRIMPIPVGKHSSSGGVQT